MITTKETIDYKATPYGYITTIPKGTNCEPATNLPPRNDGKQQHWACKWPFMSWYAERWHANYGFLIEPEEVTENK
jgi:hypothetical protein